MKDCIVGPVCRIIDTLNYIHSQQITRSRVHTLTLSVNLQTKYFFYTCVDLAIASLFRPL